MVCNRRLFCFIKLILLIITVFIISCDSCKLDEQISKKHEFFNICKKMNIKELSIVTSNEKLYYIRIDNNKIIDEFRKIIISHTFIPDHISRQFDKRVDLTIKTKKGIEYTIKIYSQPHDKSVKSNAVDISFYDNNSFDVYNMYKETKKHYRYWDDTFIKYGWGNPCYQFRNYQFNSFLKKYIDEAIKSGSKNKYGIYVESRDDT